jgi:two-component system, chemotaxis family, chemotaxis protein CheY
VLLQRLLHRADLRQFALYYSPDPEKFCNDWQLAAITAQSDQIQSGEVPLNTMRLVDRQSESRRLSTGVGPAAPLCQERCKTGLSAGNAMLNICFLALDCRNCRMPQTILTVDDSASMRQMVGATLKGAGYQVIETKDGLEALDFARTTQTDLVMTDVNMPRMDGITLVSELRTLDTYRLTPILLLTTESSPERKAQGKKAGATGWILKPFNPDQLIATLRRVLGPN